MNHLKTKSFQDKLTTHTTMIMNKFQSILSPQISQEMNNSSNSSSSTGSTNATFTIESQASEALQMEHNAIGIIRMIEELLGISRALKESWILNQVYVKDERESVEGEVHEKDVKFELEKKLEKAMMLILQRSDSLMNEVDSDEFESENEHTQEEKQKQEKPIATTEEEAQAGESAVIKEEPTRTETNKDSTNTSSTSDPDIPQEDFPMNDFANPLTLEKENKEEAKDDDMNDSSLQAELDFNNFGSSNEQKNVEAGDEEDVIMID
ncbi:hypothetical protein WICPIJ_004652 [Wickerhamomyces pijperi]|uniref:Uncharacterized protein n=1 Tax=Wickerhamomyces pijperi TaxID=599730 RepID=A0A9P8TMK1_WICPI|nr:hypothetical protein WICPIJ_004652 [Wickerhamomyces pijperi]